MYPVKQSTALTVPFFVHDASGDAVTGLTDGSFTKRISKNGAAFGAMTVTISEMENGWYSIPLSTSHSDTVGLLSITFTNAGAKQVNLQFRVHANLTDDVHSDTTILVSDTTAIHSQTTVIESDSVIVESSVQAVETDTGNIYSDTTIIASDVVILVSDTTAIHSQTTVIESDSVIVESSVQAVEAWGDPSSDLAAIESELIVVHSETTVIASDTVVIESSVQVLESQTTGIESDTTAVQALRVAGTVDTGSFTATTTEFEADDITEATADHYNGRIVIWKTGALTGQATDITDYSLSGSNGHFTVTAMTEAPANNDTFDIV